MDARSLISNISKFNTSLLLFKFFMKFPASSKQYRRRLWLCVPLLIALTAPTVLSQNNDRDQTRSAARTSTTSRPTTSRAEEAATSTSTSALPTITPTLTTSEAVPTSTINGTATDTLVPTDSVRPTDSANRGGGSKLKLSDNQIIAIAVSVGGAGLLILGLTYCFRKWKLRVSPIFSILRLLYIKSSLLYLTHLAIE
jgi:hypothetical protein